MGYAFAGLLSGLGQGLVKAGDTLEKRRQDALDWANKLQAQQDAQQAETARNSQNNDRQDRRLAFTEQNQNTRTAAQLEATTENQNTRLSSEEKLAQARIASAERIARVEANAAAARVVLSHKLDSEDNSKEVKDILPGPVGADGTSEAVVFFKDGTHTNTGVKYVPGNNYIPNYNRAQTGSGGKASPFPQTGAPQGKPSSLMRFDANGNLIH